MAFRTEISLDELLHVEARAQWAARPVYGAGCPLSWEGGGAEASAGNLPHGGQLSFLAVARSYDALLRTVEDIASKRESHLRPSGRGFQTSGSGAKTALSGIVERLPQIGDFCRVDGRFDFE